MLTIIIYLLGHQLVRSQLRFHFSFPSRRFARTFYSFLKLIFLMVLTSGKKITYSYTITKPSQNMGRSCNYNINQFAFSVK